MYSVHEFVYGQDKNVQCPAIGWFIRQARERFANSDDNFHISTTPAIELPLQSPLDEVVMLADGYKELGLWIPTKDKDEVFTGILLAWADDIYPTPTGVQYVYLTEGGNVVMCREVIPYEHVKSQGLDDIITTFII
jgi:hypothetical protein